MSRYADPERCPDCRGPIAFGAASCPSCGLPLVGEPARELFLTLARADELVAALRAEVAQVPVGAAATGPADPAPAGAAEVLDGLLGPVDSPAAPPVAEAPGTGGIRAASVPKILLALGAGCLLVAALVFLAVTWSVLGVGGRTATLVGFTVTSGALATWFARRGLRGAAEALALVALGLLTLDLLGARSAGWLGEPTTATFLVVLGVLLAVASGAAAAAVRRTAAGELTAAQVVTAIATGVLASGVGGQDWGSPPAALVAAVVAAAAVTGVAHRLDLRVATAGSSVVTGLAWLALTAVATGRALEAPTVRGAWLDLGVWPVLAAACLAAAVGLLRVPTAARVSGVAVGHGLLALALLVPLADEPASEVALGVVAILAASAAGARLLPRAWALSGLLTQTVGSAWVVAVALGLIGAAGTRLLGLAEAPWSGSAGDRLGGFDPAGLPDAWLLPVLLAALVATAWSVAGRMPVRLLPRLGPLGLAQLPTAVLACAAVGLLTLALYAVPVWSVLAAAGLACLAALAAWWRSRSPQLLAWASAYLVVAVAVGLHAQWLTLVACTAALAASVTVLLSARSTWVAAGAGLALGPSLAGLGWAGTALAGMEAQWAALTVLVMLGAVFLAVEVGDRIGLRRLGEPDEIGAAAGAVAAVLPVAVAGVLEAAQPAPWAAGYLTLAGVCAMVVGLLRHDRVPLRWAGGVLLILASWVRLADLGVETPEAYTMPAGVVLLAVGLHRLRRDRASRTVSVLSPGLGLALVPSLVWALTDPMHPRSLLLGAGCLLLVVVGARLGWTAPLVAGAAVGAVLVGRLGAPYLGDAVPRWALIGAAGAALIAMGVTWERRLAEARQVAAYVRRLR